MSTLFNIPMHIHLHPLPVTPALREHYQGTCFKHLFLFLFFSPDELTALEENKSGFIFASVIDEYIPCVDYLWYIQSQEKHHILLNFMGEYYHYCINTASVLTIRNGILFGRLKIHYIIKLSAISGFLYR